MSPRASQLSKNNSSERWLEAIANLFFAVLPFQLGKFIWFPFSSLFGLRLDYLAGSIYLTDLVGLVWVGLVLISKEKRKNLWQSLGQRQGWLGLGLLLVLFGVGWSNQVSPGLFWLTWLRLAWLFIFYQAVKVTEVNWSKGWDWLMGSLVLVCLLAWGQFFNQGSLQGLFWWLGERRFKLGEPNIAGQVLGGREWLRPYATFPHPNVLAGFLLTVLAWWRVAKKKVTWPVTGLFVSVILIAGSKPVWLVGLVLIVSQWKRKRWWGWLGLLGIGGGLISQLLTSSVSRRVWLNQCALLLWQEKWAWGWGLGQFLPLMNRCLPYLGPTRFWQPVHNLVLLGLVQFGVLGWFLVMIWLKGEWRQAKLLSWGLVALILFLGLWDHYWFTAIQSQYLLVLLIGFGAVPGSRVKIRE